MGPVWPAVVGARPQDDALQLPGLGAAHGHQQAASAWACN